MLKIVPKLLSRNTARTSPLLNPFNQLISGVKTDALSYLSLFCALY